jgi:Trm5-related predicted tRNA methylase
MKESKIILRILDDQIGLHFFDKETADQLREWLPIREKRSNYLSPKIGKRMTSDAIRMRIEFHAAEDRVA